MFHCMSSGVSSVDRIQECTFKLMFKAWNEQAIILFATISLQLYFDIILCWGRQREEQGKTDTDDEDKDSDLESIDKLEETDDDADDDDSDSDNDDDGNGWIGNFTYFYCDVFAIP